MSEGRSEAEAGTTGVRAVIGTAGHVDHGKTTLVSHLTGTDTDRLEQEKERGLSIELGFAPLELPGGAGRLAFVDVPGHERFVRQMIAGAAGIDLTMLVVAADEGVMPQTREHLDICQLLGVRAGLVVLTKTDVVEAEAGGAEWLELVREDVREVLAGTFLEDAPIATYAAGDAEAASELQALLARLVDEADERGRLAARSADRPYKLSVDRSFTMRGFGTVVTGTTAAGALEVGEPVALLPGERRGRVRRIQVHGRSTERVGPGVRAALNLQGVEHDEVGRGDVVTRPEALRTTRHVDAILRTLERVDTPLPDRSRVLVHMGTDQREATLVLIDEDAVVPGEDVPVQLRFDEPVPVLPGEPFVLRGFTVLTDYGKTVGGGRALTPADRRHRRREVGRARMIRSLAEEDPETMIAELARFEGFFGLSATALPQRLPAERSRLREALERLRERGEVVEAGGLLFHAEVVRHLEPRVASVVDAHHERHPAREGIDFAELRTRLEREVPSGLLEEVLRRMEGDGSLRVRDRLVARADFEPGLSDRQREVARRIASHLREAGLTPPRAQDLPATLDLPRASVNEALEVLVREGEVVRVSQDLYFAAEPVRELGERLRRHLEAHGTIDTGTFKEMTGASRKWTIPLGEYFDRIRLTLRVGDLRRLRG